MSDSPRRTSRDGLMETDSGDIENFTHRRSQRNPHTPSWANYIIASMGVIILILSSIIAYQSSAEPACRTPTSDAQRSLLDPAIDEPSPEQIRFVSHYSAKDAKGMAAVDAAWDAIEPTVGTVALDAQFAASLGLPAGDALLADPSKSVYVLEAYHSVHCLKVIRETLFKLAKGEKLIIPFGHATHCVAGLLEQVVCRADDTLLFYKEGMSTGDGQSRTCRNWDALRNWASRNAACYIVDDIATQHEDLTGLRCPSEDGIILGDV